MEDFERVEELKKERLLARRKKRQSKILWHVALCSSVMIILISIAVVVLKAKSVERTDTYKLVVHCTSCAEITELQKNANFEKLSEQNISLIGTCFVVGLDGEICQRVPLGEVSESALDTVSIECCVDNEEGKLNQETYDALVDLTARLIEEYNIEINDILCHYDVEDEVCSKYFVEHESAWEDFKLDVENFLEENSVKK